MAKKVIVRVNFEALGELLFAKGSTILHARPSFTDYGYSVVEFVVANESLPETEEGVMLPFVDAYTTTDADGRVRLTFGALEPKNG